MESKWSREYRQTGITTSNAEFNKQEKRLARAALRRRPQGGRVVYHDEAPIVAPFGGFAAPFVY